MVFLNNLSKREKDLKGGDSMGNDSCPIRFPDLSQVEEMVMLHPEKGVSDYREAMELANREAANRYEDYMLLSWYDRGRDFESPSHATEGPEGSPTNGYIHYALSHGATLKVDIENDRFVFFYTRVEW